MKIEMMRRGSIGIKGTIANAEHHAQNMLEIIHFMADKAKGWGFDLWRQGHNVHMFVTKDDRTFTIRPVQINGKYSGIKVCAYFGRGNEMPLFSTSLKRDLGWMLFSSFMSSLAESPNFGMAERYASQQA